MKEYFKKLFKYDAYANGLMLNTMLNANHTGKGVELMAHTLSAQQIWLGRCRHEQVDMPVWPGGVLQQLPLMFEQSKSDWINFLDTVSQEEFAGIISYKNSRGEAFSNQLQDIISHVINHGTHHRAQVGQILKQEGYATLPVTDYILFVRKLETNS